MINAQAASPSWRVEPPAVPKAAQRLRHPGTEGGDTCDTDIGVLGACELL